MNEKQRQELEELAKTFIIDYESATKDEKELLKKIDYIEGEIQRLDRERRRWLNVWKKINRELMKLQPEKVGK